jgi:hypothetical protein
VSNEGEFKKRIVNLRKLKFEHGANPDTIDFQTLETWLDEANEDFDASDSEQSYLNGRIKERCLPRKYKRIEVKGHYRAVARNTDGTFKKVKKWSSEGRSSHS